MLRRRSVLSALLCLPALAARADDSEPMPKVGQPLGTVELRVTEAKYMAFLHDLDDFAQFYGLHVVGDPANLEIHGRPILVIWYTRDDGITVLVTDATEHERMQAFFYVAEGGQPHDAIPAVIQSYRNKMSDYPPFTKQMP